MEPRKLSAAASRGMLLLPVAGAAVGIAWLSVGVANDELLAQPSYQIWLLLQGLQVGLWSALVPLNLRLYQRACASSSGVAAMVSATVGSLVLLVAVAGALWLGPSIRPVPDALESVHFRLQFVIGGGALVVVPVLSALWARRTQLAAMGFPAVAPGGRSGLAEPLRVLVGARADLLTALTAMGAMIGAATLATGGYREVYLSLGGSVAQFPPSFVLLYGAFFSVLLAAVYVPVYIVLQQRGHDLVERATGFPMHIGELAEWRKRREDLETVLGLKVSLSETLETGFGVLAPLAGSVTALLIPAVSG